MSAAWMLSWCLLAQMPPIDTQADPLPDAPLLAPQVTSGPSAPQAGEPNQPLPFRARPTDRYAHDPPAALPATDGRDGRLSTAGNPLRRSTEPAEAGRREQPVQPTAAVETFTDPKATTAANPPAAAVPSDRPLVPVRGPQDLAVAEQLLESLTTEQEHARPAGSPFPLVDALRRATTKDRQFQVLTAYWKLWHATVRFDAAAVEKKRVADLAAQHPAEAMPMALQQALAEANLRVAQARLVAKESQFELAEIAGLSPSDPLPKVADSPLVSPYRTYYEELFVNRQTSSGRYQALRLHRTLPQCLDVIAAAAKAAQVQAAGQVAAEPELALRHFEKQRRLVELFASAVQDYNLRVAEYAMLASRGVKSPSSLVEMLIRDPEPGTTQPTPATATLPDLPAAVVPATAEQPLPSRNDASGQGPLHSVVVPASP